MKVASIILAAGKGKRLNSTHVNKVALPFLGKPLIKYGVQLLQEISTPVVVVIGAFSKSVEDALKGFDVVFVHQKRRLGTGHAVEVGLQALKLHSPAHVLVGYGDHMMFYKKETIRKLIEKHQAENASLSFITTFHDDPDKLAWGRIIRNSTGKIVDSVEQKDATEEQKKVKELNAGFYCFEFDFLKKFIGKIKKSPVSHEYYINNLVKIAVKNGKKVIGCRVPFEEVGIGINQKEEIVRSQNFFLKIHSS